MPARESTPRRHDVAGLALALSVSSLGCLVAASSPTSAAWAPQGAQFAVAGDQLTPVTLADGAGGMFVAWSDGRGLSMDIYAQHLDGNGNALWSPTGVPVCTASNNQTGVKLISDGAGGFIAAWFDLRTATGLYAQRVTSTGTSLWKANGFQVAALTCLQSFALCTDGANGALFTWEKCSAVTATDIGAQRVNSAGTVRWGTSGLTVCQFANNQTSPGIALCDDGTGNCVISWADGRDGTQAGVGIFAQKVSAAGSPLWQTGGAPVTQYVAASLQWPVSVYGDGADGAVITWYDAGIGTFKVWQQRINGAGQSLWQRGGIRVGTALGAQYYPVVVRDGLGGTIVSWYDVRDDPLGDLYIQRISSAGDLQWDATGQPLVIAPGEQFTPSLSADGLGGAFVVWQDARADTAYDIYAQHVSDTGAPQWGDANGTPIGQAPLYQVMAASSADGAGGVLAAWQDYRNNIDYDVYVTRVPNQAVAIGDPAGPAVARLRVEPSLLGRGQKSAEIALAGVRESSAELVISDVSGRVVQRMTLQPNGAGDVRARWDGAGADGRGVPSGVYAVHLRAGARAWRQNLVIVR